MTKEDFKKLANACKTSEEFAERAALLDKGGVYREMYREYKVETMWDAHKAVKAALLKRVDCKGLWYEVWIDLEEAWESMWPILKNMEFSERVERCAQYVNDQERFYGSSDYIDMLNGMLAEVEKEKD